MQKNLKKNNIEMDVREVGRANLNNTVKCTGSVS